jgi:hypothetical protein
MLPSWTRSYKKDDEYLLNLIGDDEQLHSFALKFIFLQSHATSPVFLQNYAASSVYTDQLLNTVKEKGRKPDRKPYRNLKTENAQDYVHEFDFRRTFKSLQVCNTGKEKVL